MANQREQNTSPPQQLVRLPFQNPARLGRPMRGQTLPTLADAADAAYIAENDTACAPVYATSDAYVSIAVVSVSCADDATPAVAPAHSAASMASDALAIAATTVAAENAPKASGLYVTSFRTRNAVIAAAAVDANQVSKRRRHPFRDPPHVSHAEAATDSAEARRCQSQYND
eukprot:TRINITY_DN43499_c0_g1_i1.p3 TRINITY_DN43499_c0_g1~~TRINITY_DN43499_c0_g1_i1.p3  ORF type:complete len:172 (+),score=25.39 TRINITY_DN43499_c0_g1_i1:442-957(+)